MNLPVGAVHHVPGRIRIRLPFLRRDTKNLDEIKAFLERIEGVQYVRANSLTGSLLLWYDRAEYDTFFDHLTEAVKKNFRLLVAATPSLLKANARSNFDQIPTDTNTPSQASLALAAAFRSLDGRIRTATDNTFDLKSLLPIGVVGGALLRLGAQAATPLWVTLAIFSFSYYLVLDSDASKPDDIKEASPGEDSDTAAEVMTTNA